MWVNGEKYIFSDHVVQGGLELSSHLGKLIEMIKQIYKNCSDDSFDYSVVEIANEKTPHNLRTLSAELAKFDKLWMSYEKEYIGELMVIETDARRFITDSIKVEANLTLRERNGFLSTIDDAQEDLIELIGGVNAVANTEGKGRDDFDIRTLKGAERLLKSG